MENQKLVYVVDDELSIRHKFQRYLKKLGFKVEALSNGSDALLLCMYMVPDLIITDIRMPKLNGITLLRALKNNEATKQVPIIFMTAYPNEELIEEAKQLGAKYFLVKPFPLNYLDDLLQRAIPHLIPKDHDTLAAEQGQGI